jgi:hypothetical protein
MSANQPGTVFDTIPANTFDPNKPLETVDGRPMRLLGSIASKYPHVVALHLSVGGEMIYSVDGRGEPDPASGGPRVVSVVTKVPKHFRLVRDRRHVLSFEEPGDGRLGGSEVIAEFDAVFVGWQFVGFENVRTDVDPDPR